MFVLVRVLQKNRTKSRTTVFLGSSAGKKNLLTMQENMVQYLGQEDPGIGYPLQYSWAFLVPQMVKNPPAVWGTWV